MWSDLASGILYTTPPLASLLPKPSTLRPGSASSTTCPTASRSTCVQRRVRLRPPCTVPTTCTSCASICDHSNRALQNRTFHHRSSSDHAVHDNFAMSCILQNVINAYCDINHMIRKTLILVALLSAMLYSFMPSPYLIILCSSRNSFSQKKLDFCGPGMMYNKCIYTKI